MDNKLSELYYNPESGFVSKSKFYKVKHLGYTKQLVDDFINKQDIHQIFKVKEKHYNAIIGTNEDYQMDLMFYPKYKSENDGYDTIMNIINITSRKVYSEPMKGKTQAEVKRAFEVLFKQIPTINNMTSDNEASFKNAIKPHTEITHWRVEPNDKTKVAMVERFNRTLSGMIEKYMKLKKTKTWYKILPFFIKNYNSTVHSTIGIAPNDFKQEDGDRIRKEAMQRSLIALQETNSFKPGDRVRILKRKKLFDKGTEKWSKPIYSIESKAHPMSFNVKSPNGVVLLGAFKNWQLQKVSASETPDLPQEEPVHHVKEINATQKAPKTSQFGDQQ